MKEEGPHPVILGQTLKTAKKCGLLPTAVPCVSLSCSMATAVSPPKSSPAVKDTGCLVKGPQGSLQYRILPIEIRRLHLGPV